jgi:hypothetical protein
LSTAFDAGCVAKHHEFQDFSDLPLVHVVVVDDDDDDDVID